MTKARWSAIKAVAISPRAIDGTTRKTNVVNRTGPF
jgi:hypothetical protein